MVVIPNSRNRHTTASRTVGIVGHYGRRMRAAKARCILARRGPVMPLIPGTRLGQYEVISALGRGGMGEVYRARDTRLDRDVAVKILSKDLSSRPGHTERLEQEAKVLASLNHPNIAAIHGFEDGG